MMPIPIITRKENLSLARIFLYSVFLPITTCRYAVHIYVYVYEMEIARLKRGTEKCAFSAQYKSHGTKKIQSIETERR